MRLLSLALFLFCTLELTALQSAQPSAASTITFSNSGAVASVQMSGTANWIFGSDSQTGAVQLQAYANGQSRLQLVLSAGTRVEVQNPFADSQRQCTWTSFDGTVHNSAIQHCWLDTVWFLPQITMQLGAGAPDDFSSVTTVNAQTIRFHHERHPSNVADKQTSDLVSHLSAVDLDVEAGTGLPVRLRFAEHPDNDAGVDLPVEIRYGAYSNFNGVAVPTHIQKFINNVLVLDLQISDVQIQFASPGSTLQ